PSATAADSSSMRASPTACRARRSTRRSCAGSGGGPGPASPTPWPRPMPGSSALLRRSSRMHERFYRSLYRIRRVEEEVARVYPSDCTKSPVHLSIGQEAISVGVCEALRHHDVVFGTYRGHALYLAKGGPLRQMIAELYGKATGCAQGKGGSMHLIDTDAGVMGTSAIV